jgi:hypothetical protein
MRAIKWKTGAKSSKEIGEEVTGAAPRMEAISEILFKNLFFLTTIALLYRNSMVAIVLDGTHFSESKRVRAYFG